jgi:hypothetical protein
MHRKPSLDFFCAGRPQDQQHIRGPLKWSADHDEPLVDELIHELRVGRPFGLPFHRNRVIPGRPT